MEDPAGGFGNNIFLDEINFTAPLGVNELTKSIGFNLYPNPTPGVANIEFSLNDASGIKYSVCDVVGRIVEQEKSFNLQPGHYVYSINENQKLQSGVYFINFEMNGQHMSRKLIIE